RAGGKWVWELRKGDESDMDRAWVATLVGLIGESFTDSGAVNGAVVSLRKGRNRLALWTRGADKAQAMRIGEEWKKMIGLGSSVRIGFQAHAQAMSKAKSEIRNLWEL